MIGEFTVLSAVQFMVVIVLGFAAAALGTAGAMAVAFMWLRR